MGEPKWMYQNGELQGPTPIPPLKTATTVPALVLHACPHHDVAEVDHELGVVALGTGTVAKPWETTYIEHEYRAGDSYGVGWYSRYRRDGDNFVLTHVWADTWDVLRWQRW